MVGRQNERGGQYAVTVSHIHCIPPPDLPWQPGPPPAPASPSCTPPTSRRGCPGFQALPARARAPTHSLSLLRTNQARRELLVQLCGGGACEGPQGQAGRARRLSSIFTPLPRPSVAVVGRTENRQEWDAHFMPPTHPTQSAPDAAFQKYCISSDGKICIAQGAGEDTGWDGASRTIFC